MVYFVCIRAYIMFIFSKCLDHVCGLSTDLHISMNMVCVLTVKGLNRDCARSYKILYLFLKNKTSYIFLTSLIFMSCFGCVLSGCQNRF